MNEIKIEAPNIFKYATKELSQDAFLCWLFSFADIDYKYSDYKNLHNVALNLLNKFIDVDGYIVEKVIVKKQIKNIDIWIEINSELLIVIEDKTNSVASDNQLSKYYKTASDYCIKNRFQHPICIYFKTGSEALKVFNSSNINEKWKYFSLKALIDILTPFEEKIDHPYFRDFYKINKQRFDLTINFDRHICKEDLKNLDNELIEAFYSKLENDKIFHNWKYLDSRGVRRYYANNYSYQSNTANVYLQLDRMDLKLRIDLGKLGNEKGKIYKKFQENLKKNDIKSIYSGVRSIIENHSKFNEIIFKPSKFASHNFLIFATIPPEIWFHTNSSGFMDYEKTKEKIKSLNNDLTEVTEQHQQEILDIVNIAFKN